MLRARLLSSAIAAALVFSAAAQAGTTDFNKVVVIGDSLSDNGNLSLASGATQPSRFTTNPGKVAVEVMADHYGYTLTPSLMGGTDYAFGGAGFIHNSPGTPTGIPTITDQVNGLLAGGLDGHTLYTMWGGANDIFYHATYAGLGQETPAQAQAGVAAAAAQELALLGQMHASGARYVVVFNLPDIGLTPSAASQGASAQQALSGMSLIYNGVLGSQLNQLSDAGLNIVPVNVYALFNEVAANPSAFGFSNISVPACLTGADTHSAGLTSVQCGPEGSGAPYTYAPGTENSYLFADGVHPTTAAHAMLGQYVIAELAAPGQASMLAEVPLATIDSQLATLGTQMGLDRGGASSRVFVNLGFARQRFDATGDSPKTTTHDTDFTIGVDATVADNFSLGFAIGNSRSKADVGTGSFKLNAILGIGYAHWHQDGGYLSANLGFGQLDYNDITRRLQIGSLQRMESGQTGGNLVTGGLAGGWLFGSDSFKTGPFVSAQWQRVRVEGYSEKSGDSTAMWFDHQTRQSMVQTVGWEFKGNWAAGTSVLHPYLKAAWNHDARADARKVDAGLTGMQGHFALTGFVPDQSWVSADLGLTAELGDSARTWIAYRGQFGRDNQRSNYLSLGMSVGF